MPPTSEYRVGRGCCALRGLKGAEWKSAESKRDNWNIYIYIYVCAGKEKERRMSRSRRDEKQPITMATDELADTKVNFEDFKLKKSYRMEPLVNRYSKISFFSESISRKISVLMTPLCFTIFSTTLPKIPSLSMQMSSSKWKKKKSRVFTSYRKIPKTYNDTPLTAAWTRTRTRRRIEGSINVARWRGAPLVTCSRRRILCVLRPADRRKGFRRTRLPLLVYLLRCVLEPCALRKNAQVFFQKYGDRKFNHEVFKLKWERMRFMTRA